MRIIFAGTPEFAAIALQALIDAQMNIVQVLTQSDKPAGRGMQLQTSAVKKLATKHAISVLQPNTLRDETIQTQLKTFKPDVMVVAAYGLILPQAILEIPRLGCINIHASLLPRWRGAAPIHRAIEAGDVTTGVTIMQMDPGLDTGAMLLQQAIPIETTDTTVSLHDKLAYLGGQLIVQALHKLNAGTLHGITQPMRGITYAHKVSKEEARIDWSRNAIELERQIRAFNPFPGSVIYSQGGLIKVWQASVISAQGQPGEILRLPAISSSTSGIIVACGTDALSLEVLQRAGGKRLPATEFLQGFPLTVGDSLV